MRNFDRMRQLADRPEEREASIRYLAEHLSFLKRNEKVLICFESHEEASISSLMEQAVRLCGAEPIVWGEDQRWKTLLRLAFSRRVTTVIGAPLLILGLAKMARVRATPLYIRNVVTAGYPCLDWMIDGIRNGLDCKTWGCFDVHMSNIVLGFSCEHSLGVHLREEKYAVEIVDPDGDALPDGQQGSIVVYRKDAPELRIPLKESGTIEIAPCACGDPKRRLTHIHQGMELDTDLADLGQYLLSWSSVLDCRLRKGECGLEMEVVVFAGEKLPEFPSAAKREIRIWNSDKDTPFWYIPWAEKSVE